MWDLRGLSRLEPCLPQVAVGHKRSERGNWKGHGVLSPVTHEEAGPERESDSGKATQLVSGQGFRQVPTAHTACLPSCHLLSGQLWQCWSLCASLSSAFVLSLTHFSDLTHL